MIFGVQQTKVSQVIVSSVMIWLLKDHRCRRFGPLRTLTIKYILLAIILHFCWCKKCVFIEVCVLFHLFHLCHRPHSNNIQVPVVTWPKFHSCYVMMRVYSLSSAMLPTLVASSDCSSVRSSAWVYPWHSLPLPERCWSRWRFKLSGRLRTPARRRTGEGQKQERFTLLLKVSVKYLKQSY